MITSGNRTLIHEVIQAPTLYSRVMRSKRPLVSFEVVSGTEQPANDRPPKMSPIEYYWLLKNLISNGRLEHKHANVLAFELPRLEGETLQDTGQHEMSEALLRPERALVMDMTYFPDPPEADKIMQRVFNLYGKAMTDRGVRDALNSGQLVKCVVRSIGMWTVEATRFFAKQMKGEGYKGDFVQTDTPNMFKSLPGTGRVITGHNGEDRNMIVKYNGGFDVRKTAGVATFFDKIGKIINIVNLIEEDAARHGDVIREEAVVEYACNIVPLFDPNTKEPIIDPKTNTQAFEIQAKEDVYAMFLGFRVNYIPFMQGEMLTDDGKHAVELLSAAGNPMPLLPKPRARSIFQIVARR